LHILRPVPAERGGFEKVFAFLREQLLSGAITPGDRLAGERELAVQLGVSRPMLREALRALAVLGVVEIRQGSGTVVRRPDVAVLGDFFAFAVTRHPSLVEDVMQARIAIECQAIRLACERATLSDCEELRAALDGIIATIDDPDSGGLADHRFHAALVAAAHSATLATLYGAITALLLHSHRDRRKLLSRIEDGRTYLINHHRRVFDSVVAREPNQADAILREHFAIGDEYRRRTVIAPDAGTPPPSPNRQDIRP
jgi:DNA-binding FadR family transcriptional regulator